MYVCMCMNTCVGFCMLWLTGRIIISIFEVVPKYQKDLLLSILVCRLHKELCPGEPARLVESTRDVGQSGVRLRSRKSGIQA